jgi:uncharacterized protein (TIGR02099 family)
MNESFIVHQLKRLRPVLGRCWLYFGILVVLAAISFSVFRALTPWARQYKPMVEAQLSSMLGRPVSINSMETGWYWFHPVFQLNQVALTASNQQAFQLHKLLIGINLWRSIWHWKIVPGILYLDRTNFVLRQVNGQWTLDGLDLGQQTTPIGIEGYLSILNALSSQEKIIARHVSTILYFENGRIISLRAVNVTLENQNGRYRLQGTGQLARSPHTEFSVFADIQLDASALNKTKGQLYISAKSLALKQWQHLWPALPVSPADGNGNLTVWLNYNKGLLSEVQSELSFKKLSLQQLGKKKPLLVDKISANLGWKRANDGWLFSADHFQLEMNDVKWPENSMSLQYNSTQQTSKFFAKHILIGPLLAIHLPWPEEVQPIISMKPSGQLYDTALHFQGKSLTYVLTGFSDLSFKKSSQIPTVFGLSGVLNWQPHQGRLALDSYQTQVTFQGYPPISLTHLNTALEWHQESTGTQMNLERLVLQHPDLSVVASGRLDDLEHYPQSQVHLMAQYSAKHVEQWMKYIPPHLLKVKLEAWLKQDIQSIDKMLGKVALDGLMADFPFENKTGTFSIQSHFNGVDLRIGPHWPMTRDIEADLTVDKRNLNVDIHHADFNGMNVSQINLRIDDIGLDYENLLVHAKLTAPAEQLFTTVFQTPLSDRLRKLKSLELHGLLGLDLQLEAPLYPENNDVLTKGELTLDKNEAVLHLGEAGVPLTDITGSVQFNEKGVSDSTLTTNINGLPFVMNIIRVDKPTPAAEVTLKGDTTVDDLYQLFDFPVLELMKGPLTLDMVLTLPDSSKERDKLQIHSDLKNVSVRLPKPLGKVEGTNAEFTTQLDFDKDNSMRVRLDYDSRLSADLRVDLLKSRMSLNRGEIHLGAGSAVSPKEKGIKISGTLPLLDVLKWRKALSIFSTESSSASFVDSVKWIDLAIGRLRMLHQNMDDIVVKATRLDSHDWSVQIQQKYLTADVRYQPSTNSLSGDVERLYIENAVMTTNAASQEGNKLAPGDIPNLQLSVKHFIYGDVDVGQVDLLSKSTKQAWTLESCKVSTPGYELVLSGDWIQDQLINRTNLKANLSIRNLAQSFERWHVKPAVVVNKGRASFVGGWQGGVLDGSFLKIMGQLQVVLSGGRITDLSSATEGKIGFGKVLSIFSLQTIPRRLTLDFSDLSQDGFSFDQFKGDFELQKGVLNTQNSIMDGPVAYVSMKGDIDLIKQLLSLELYVSPHVMASLPVVATIAGGPILGIATWAASKIINQGMLKVTGYSYQVSGTWKDPLIKEVGIVKKNVRR